MTNPENRLRFVFDPLSEPPPSLLPWQIQPDRLWSLWDMTKDVLRPYASAFVWLSQIVADVGQLDRRESVRDAAHDRLRRGRQGSMHMLVQAGIAILPSWEKSLPLKSTMFQYKEIMQMIERGCDAGDLFDPMRELGKRFHQDLQGEQFYHVDGRLIETFNKPGFSDETIAAFPDVEDDLAEAGKCLALGRNKACVLHLMLAMEVALRALAQKVGATVTDKHGKWLTWLIIAGNLEPQIRAMPEGQVKDAWWEVKTMLTAVGKAWRNTSMHPARTYDAIQAEKVFNTTKGFMHDLAVLI